MQIQFAKDGHCGAFFASTVLLAAVFCSVFAALDWLRLLPAALVGLVIPAAGQLLRRKKPIYLYALLGLLVAYLLIRFFTISDGVKLLVNQMYSCSEIQQAYEYEYFEVSGGNPWEAVLWLSLLAGTLCALWKNWFTGIVTIAWVGAMIYFGVTPGIGWLMLLGAACLWNVVPFEQIWFHGGIIVLLLLMTAFVVRAAAPAPSATLSAWDNHVRDQLALHSLYYEQTISKTEVPTPEPEPQPSEPPVEQNQIPNQRIWSSSVNVLFIVLSVITAILLFSHAILKDRVEKRRQENRAGLDAADNAAAIRAMYLYVRRWRELMDMPAAVPERVRAIWLEAAYSEHRMADIQRKIMYKYLEQTATSVWKAAGRKKRLMIRYKIAL